MEETARDLVYCSYIIFHLEKASTYFVVCHLFFGVFFLFPLMFEIEIKTLSAASLRIIHFQDL